MVAGGTPAFINLSAINSRRASSRGPSRRPTPASAKWVSASARSPSRAVASARRAWARCNSSSGRRTTRERSATERSASASRSGAEASASLVSAPNVCAPLANSGSVEALASVARGAHAAAAAKSSQRMRTSPTRLSRILVCGGVRLGLHSIDFRQGRQSDELQDGFNTFNSPLRRERTLDTRNEHIRAHDALDFLPDHGCRFGVRRRRRATILGVRRIHPIVLRLQRRLAPHRPPQACDRRTLPPMAPRCSAAT